MNKYMEQMQAKIINNVRFENAKHQSQVREALEKAISNCIKNFAKNGWEPDAEEKFWGSIEKIVSENPENRKVYRQYEDLQFLYQYAENWYYSYPSNLTMEDRELALGYAEVKRPDTDNEQKYITVFFPCDAEGLQVFLDDHKVSNQDDKQIYHIYCENEKTNALAEWFEEISMQKVDVFAVNALFWKYNQLSEELQKVYSLALELKEPQSVKEMIDLMENFSDICVVGGIKNKKELGAFLVENDLCDISFSDEVLPFLDYAKIAEYHMQYHNGKIVDGMYVEDTAVTEGLQEEQIEQDCNYDIYM